MKWLGCVPEHWEVRRLKHAVVAIVHPGHSTDWFSAVLQVMNLNQYSVSAAQPGLAVERILNLPLPVPPGPEQNRIADHVGETTTDIDAAIIRARRQIELLQEYRTRLIADVVTGKLDVREAAAGLPDEGDEEAIGEDGFRAGSIDEDLHDANGLV